jgi:tetratricopeptide (TPR) repeat protein
LRRIFALGLFSGCLFAQSPLEKAVVLTKEKHYAQANQALAGVPEPSDSSQRIAFHRLKAAVAAGLGKPADAANEMRQALALAPGDTNLLLATAVSELSAALLNDALQHAREAGNTPMAQAVVGDIQERRGDYTAAANAYQNAVLLAPTQESYRIALAFELIQHQRFGAAIELLEQAKPLFPKSAKILTLLGIAQYAKGSSEEAVSSLEDAIDIDPNFDSAYGCLVRILLESPGSVPQRAATLLCHWDAVACSAIRIRELRASDDLAGMHRAMAVLERAPAGNTVARCELGRAYEESNQLQAARPHMEACARLDSTPRNHYRLALLYRQLGLAAQARKELALRIEIQSKMSQETAVGMNALESFSVSHNSAGVGTRPVP